MSTDSFPEKELTYAIIGAAMDVHRELGYGFLEKVYEKALLVALAETQIKACNQKAIAVFYHGQNVGDYFADILVEGKVIVELKSHEYIIPEHRAQLLNYLKATKTKVGLLINFAKDKLEHERFVY